MGTVLFTVIFSFDHVALLAGCVVILKKLLPTVLIFAPKWLVTFFFSYVPRKVVMYLVRCGVIDRKSQLRLNNYFLVQRRKLAHYSRKKFPWVYALHFSARLIALTIMMGIIVIVSTLVTGWWIIFIWIPEEAGLFLKPLWGKLATALSNTTAVKSFNWCYAAIAQTWFGHTLVWIVTFFEDTILKPVEQRGVHERKKWFPIVHETISKLPQTHIVVAPAIRHKPSRNPYAEQQIRKHCMHAERSTDPKSKPRLKH